MILFTGSLLLISILIVIFILSIVVLTFRSWPWVLALRHRSLALTLEE